MMQNFDAISMADLQQRVTQCESAADVQRLWVQVEKLLLQKYDPQLQLALCGLLLNRCAPIEVLLAASALLQTPSLRGRGLLLEAYLSNAWEMRDPDGGPTIPSV